MEPTGEIRLSFQQNFSNLSIILHNINSAGMSNEFCPWPSCGLKLLKNLFPEKPLYRVINTLRKRDPPAPLLF